MNNKIKNSLLKKHKFFAKSQFFFFTCIFVAIMLLIFFSTIGLFSYILLAIILFIIVFWAGNLYIEAKAEKDLIEEFMLYYGMKKSQKKHGKRKKT